MATTIPIELKSITPFITRANELTKADPVISYWCTFYAVQHAMTLGSKDPESNVYLFSLMDKLELMKQELDGNDNVTSDDSASAYVESFAEKIFDQADNEDRTGAGTRMTAKKFLAAGNFLELLSIFGEISTENREKIKYSKWKASDIAKAFREGRVPVPGPAGGLPPPAPSAPAPTEEDEDTLEMTNEEARELAKEFDRMQNGSTTTEEEENLTPGLNTKFNLVSPPVATAPSAMEDEDIESYPFPQQPTTFPSSTFSTPTLFDQPQTPLGDEHPTTPSFPSFLNTPTTVPGSSTSTPPTPIAPPIILPPPSHQTADLPPPNPSQHATKPIFPSAVFPIIPTISKVQAPSWTTPPVIDLAPFPIAVPSPIVAPIVTLDPSVITKIQKHCRWASSALNYEDLVTARAELRAALALLGE